MREDLLVAPSLQNTEALSFAVQNAAPFRETEIGEVAFPDSFTASVLPRPPHRAFDEGQKDRTSKWIYTGRELLETQLTKPPCLLDPVLQTTGFSLLIGESDIGKTWLALSLLLAVASGGSEWLGYPLRPIHGKAILIATEDSEYNLSARFHGLQSAFPSVAWRDNVSVLIADDKTNAEILSKLSEMIAREPVDLIIADCFGDLFDGRDANSQADTRKFYKQFAPLSKQCHFMLVHHKAKRTEDKTPSKNHALGSQAIEAKARTVFDLTESNGQFFLSVLKCKASRQEKKNSKRLEFEEALLIFRDTGETSLRSQIGMEAESKIDWKPIFRGKESMKKTDLAESLMGISNQGRSTAFKRIKQALDRGELQVDDFANILSPIGETSIGSVAEILSNPSNIPMDLDGLDKSVDALQESGSL